MDFSFQSFKEACRSRGPLLEAWLRAYDRQYGARDYRDAAASLGSWQVAQDVVQDGMIKVWLRCATFTGPASPIAWIRTIIRNTLLDHLDSRRPEQPLLDDDGQVTAEADAAISALSMQSSQTPDAQLQEREVESVYRACFGQFARDFPAHAQVLRWVVDEGLSNADIENLLERSPGATREFISQARKKARRYLQPWYDLVRPVGSPAKGREIDQESRGC